MSSSDTPQSVHHSSIAPQPQKAIGCGDPVGIRFAGIAKKGVRNPNLSHHVTVQHKHLHRAVELKSAVVPCLSEEDVYSILLQNNSFLFPQFVLTEGNNSQLTAHGNTFKKSYRKVLNICVRNVLYAMRVVGMNLPCWWDPLGRCCSHTQLSESQLVSLQKYAFPFIYGIKWVSICFFLLLCCI